MSEEQNASESPSCPSRCSTSRVNPIVILKTGTMTPEDIAALRENGICAVESTEPDSVRFIEPPPSGYDHVEWAAVQLFRKLMAARDYSVDRKTVATMFTDVLLNGTRLEAVPHVPENGHAQRGRPKKGT